MATCHRIGVVCALLIGTIVPASLLAQDSSSVEETRTLVSKWVEARKLIASEQADWTEEKAVLQQLIARYEAELSDVDAQIEEATSSAEKAQKEREALLAENDDLIEAADTMKTLVVDLEKRLKTVIQLFPEPLVVDTLDRLIKQMPEDPEDTRASLSARLQLIVAILQESQKFNSGIIVASEIRTNEAGEEVQVETLYLGLSQAFFVDQSRDFAGVGVPTEDGWEWTVNPEMGSAIGRVISQYNEVTPASFTGLPVEVR